MIVVALFFIGCSNFLPLFQVTHNLAYDANGATAGYAPVDATEYEIGHIATVLDNIGNLRRTGHAFECWNTASNGAGASYAPGSGLLIEAMGLTLFAEWSPDPGYTVVYDGNGNTDGTPPIDNQTYGLGTAVWLAGPGTLARTNYMFFAWNDAADGSCTNHFPSTTVTVGTEDIKLYAQWAALGSIW